MRFTFENQGTMTYLVYAITPDDCIDNMSLGMLTNNKIHGLAPAIFTQMDATKYIKYNVSAKISVKQFFEGQVNKKRLIGVFNGIVDAIFSAEDFMIDTNTILLDLDYIFTDVSTCETALICLPVFGQGAGTNLSTFFKTIMFTTQFDQTENCDYVARIINYLNSSPVFSLVDFKAVLDSISTAVTSTTREHPMIRSMPQIQEKPVQQTIASTMQQSVQAVPVNISSVSTEPPKHQTVQPQVQTQNKQWQVSQSQPIVPQDCQPEKQITMFRLLMHYSKESKALYSAQKAAKKVNKGESATPQQSKKQTTTTFAVPGVDSSADYAVPRLPTTHANIQQQAQQPKTAQVQQPLCAQTTYTPPVQQTVIQSTAYQAQQIPQMPQMQPQTRPMSFGETTVLGGGNIGETTVLGRAAQNVQLLPHLIRSKNNERIDINKPVFRVGKEKSYVDYFVSDNTAVSRSHANIISRDGEYFVVDTNSTNHTFVNGSMILSNSETKISHGDKIRLANEEFEFRLY